MLKKIILYIILLLSFIGLIYSAYKIVCWCIDNKNTKEQILGVNYSDLYILGIIIIIIILISLYLIIKNRNNNKI